MRVGRWHILKQQLRVHGAADSRLVCQLMHQQQVLCGASNVAVSMAGLAAATARRKDFSGDSASEGEYCQSSWSVLALTLCNISTDVMSAGSSNTSADLKPAAPVSRSASWQECRCKVTVQQLATGSMRAAAAARFPVALQVLVSSDHRMAD